ncbi:MAG: carbohydrate porin [Verrucomicrobiales bacterium]|nr:carbohydrate porin [Verrucomicrobiales bacterium]
MKNSATALLGVLILCSSLLNAGETINDHSAKAVEFEAPDAAVTPYFGYVFDYFHNTRGGFQTGGTAMGTFDIGAEIDLDVLFGWEGASFVVSAFAGHGSDFSGNIVGDLGVVSNIYTNTNFNIYHLYFEQALGEGDSLLRIGQFAIDDDFMVSEPGSLFIGSAFAPFNTQSANMPGPIFPLAAPGALYRYSPTGEWYLQTAVFTGNAGPGGPRDRGFEWNFGGPSGFAVFSEAGFNFQENSVAKFGGYWHTGDFTQFSTGNTVDGLGAIYGIVDHRIIDGGEDSQCLDVFVRGSIAGSDDRVVATNQVDAGLVASHLFTREDALGVAVNHTTFGDDYLNATPGMTGSETVIEATYRVQVNENFAIQPDVQYIVGPHFSGRDALAVGIRGEISF